MSAAVDVLRTAPDKTPMSTALVALRCGVTTFLEYEPEQAEPTRSEVTPCDRCFRAFAAELLVSGICPGCCLTYAAYETAGAMLRAREASKS